MGGDWTEAKISSEHNSKSITTPSYAVRDCRDQRPEGDDLRLAGPTALHIVGLSYTAEFCRSPAATTVSLCYHASSVIVVSHVLVACLEHTQGTMVALRLFAAALPKP